MADKELKEERKLEPKEPDAGELAEQEQAAVQKALDDGEAAAEKAAKEAEKTQ